MSVCGYHKVTRNSCAQNESSISGPDHSQKHLRSLRSISLRLRGEGNRIASQSGRLTKSCVRCDVHSVGEQLLHGLIRCPGIVEQDDLSQVMLDG